MNLIYYLDTKIPKSLNQFVTLFIDDFIEYVSSGGTVKINKKLAEGAVKCFCYNILRSGVYDNHLRITLDQNNYNGNLTYNGRKIKRNKVSYKYTRCFLDFMVSRGYIHLEIGGIESWVLNKDGVWVPDVTTQSTIYRLTPLDIELEPYLDKTRLKGIPDVIVLKNAKGKEVQFKTTPEIKEIIEMLDKYNALALRHTVMIGDEEYEIQGKKVFNNSSFEDGGRTYYEGGSIQILSSDIRKSITIDGSPVCSLDYTALHPSICAVKEGILLPEGFDPYAVTIKGFDDELVRSLCKMVMLVCINAKDLRSAVGAITSEIASDYRKMKKGEDCKWSLLHSHPKPFPTKDAITLLINRNQYLVPYFHTGYGIKLQNIDSRIMDNIIDRFLQKDELVLLIHDEVICREGIKDDVLYAMKEAYKEVLGTYDNCKIEEK